MNYANIKYNDIADGEGIRTSLFVSGCTHHCKGCFNEEAWDFNYGKPFTREVEDRILESLKPSYIAGLTLLGGEPFEPANQRVLVPFLKRVREQLPDKNIWCYTGYLFDEDICGKMLDRVPETRELLSCIDVLIDGPFIEERKNLKIRFRGSDNQRIIDVKKTMEAGEIVLWEEE